MSRIPPRKVQKLQAALHAKAKGSPDYRFYLLYDKLYRADVLAFAYRCCVANGGAAGVDGQTFEAIETYGEQRWLDELTEYACHRLRQWLRAKHKLQGEEKSRFSDRILEEQLGLTRLQGRTRNFPWANA